jgi:superfamily II DNA or RNA helicase
MSRQEHVGSGVKAAQKYASDPHIVVFCVTIAHAQAVMDAFKAAGYVAATVRSKMPMKQRDIVLKMFERGYLRVLCNVGVLTEGWDSPAFDCMSLPRRIEAVENGRWINVHSWKVNPWNENLDDFDNGQAPQTDNITS